MEHPPMNRAILCFGAGLCLVGGLALCGLAAPLASGYLWPDEIAGGSAITRTSSPLVEVRFTEAGGHLRPLQGGRLFGLWVEPGPDAPAPCPPEPGQA
jgi:hypothetical protein